MLVLYWSHWKQWERCAHLPIYLFAHLFICLFIYLSICLFVYSYICLFLYMFFVYLCLCLFVYLYIFSLFISFIQHTTVLVKCHFVSIDERLLEVKKGGGPLPFRGPRVFGSILWNGILGIGRINRGVVLFSWVFAFK
jgi:hypothetical protein